MQTIEFKLPESLTDEIKALKKELQEIKDNFIPKEQTKYLSRNQVAEMLGINVSSVHNWTQKGILQAYQIGGRVYYKRKELEAAIVKLQK